MNLKDLMTVCHEPDDEDILKLTRNRVIRENPVINISEKTDETLYDFIRKPNKKEKKCK